MVLRRAGAARIEVCADDQRVRSSAVERTKGRKVYEVQGLAKSPEGIRTRGIEVPGKSKPKENLL